MPTPATAKTKKTAKKDEEMEPLPAIFNLDDEEEVSEEDEELNPPPKRVARNVGSLLDNEGGERVLSPAAHAHIGAGGGDEGDDEEDEETAPKGPHAASVYWQEAKRIGPAHAKAALLGKLAGRVRQHVVDVLKWDQNDSDPIKAARLHLLQAVEHIEHAGKSLTLLPLGWTPPSKPAAGGPKVLAEGTKVSIKESARKEYDGVLEPKEMTGLSVVRHEAGKPKVACKTAEGSRVVIPRAHLVVDTSTEEPASEEAPAEE